jgi:hypothetical protein
MVVLKQAGQSVLQICKDAEQNQTGMNCPIASPHPVVRGDEMQGRFAQQSAPAIHDRVP